VNERWKLFKSWITSDRVLLVIAILLILFNFIDGGLSWYLILFKGIATEANPVMGFLMEKGVLWFLGFKLVIIPILVAFLYKIRSQPLATFGIVFTFVLYAILMVWFVANLLLFATCGYL